MAHPPPVTPCLGPPPQALAATHPLQPNQTTIRVLRPSINKPEPLATGGKRDGGREREGQGEKKVFIFFLVEKEIIIIIIF